MRPTIILLACASLAGCDRNSSGEQPTAAVVPAAVTYEGAGTTNRVATLAHGERLSWILGCSGCHGADFQGRNVTKEDPGFGDMNAPNLTLLLPSYNDAELDRAIRHGVPKDSREIWFMPPENFQHLSDADYAALVAYLRSFKPAGKQMPPIRKGPGFIRLVEKGELEPAVALVARFQKEQPVALGKSHRLGRYVAMTTCAECHNSMLQGYKDFSPNLIVAGAYSREEFERLLTQGLPSGDRKLKNELMANVAKERFTRLTHRERDALYAYLKARAERSQ